ncbi:MAG TPA: hypothetical protein VHX38_37060 [Pseudonocardiaceae bacterium]|jgi:hypothetical protein|nr:hypothetical protein [Pseudonocardiaceae bacterium]
MTEAGIVTVAGPGSWWAWAGLRLTPTTPDAPSVQPAPPPIADHLGGTVNQFAGSARHVVQARDVHGGVHFHAAQAQERPPDVLPWLRTWWQAAVGPGAAVELRLLNQPGGAGLAAFALLRTSAPDQLTAIETAARLRAGLPAGLSFLRAEPVDSEATLHGLLAPFTPHRLGLVEIRKRLTVARSTRGDARWPWLAAVTPLTGDAVSWQPMWAELAALPAPALLSVRLAPVRIGPGLRAHLAAQAGEFARLAQPGSPPTATWAVPRPPDEFAVAAAPLCSAAVSRYTEAAFAIRVSLASAAPLPDALPVLLADTISPARPGSGFLGDAPVVVRPAGADRLGVAWQNITALNADPVGPVEPDGVPAEALSEVARVLVTTADLHEAAALFRPPYRSETAPNLFG